MPYSPIYPEPPSGLGFLPDPQTQTDPRSSMAASSSAFHSPYAPLGVRRWAQLGTPERALLLLGISLTLASALFCFSAQPLSHPFFGFVFRFLVATALFWASFRFLRTAATFVCNNGPPGTQCATVWVPAGISVNDMGQQQPRSPENPMRAIMESLLFDSPRSSLYWAIGAALLTSIFVWLSSHILLLLLAALFSYLLATAVDRHWRAISVVLGPTVSRLIVAPVHQFYWWRSFFFVVFLSKPEPEDAGPHDTTANIQIVSDTGINNYNSSSRLPSHHGLPTPAPHNRRGMPSGSQGGPNAPPAATDPFAFQPLL